jgi:outer membrane protein
MKTTLRIAALILVAATPVFAQEPAPAALAPVAAPANVALVPINSLTLREAIRLAAERNLDVRAELYNPAIAEALIRQNLGIYDANLTLSGSYSGSDTLPTSSISSAGTIRQRAATMDLGANRLLPTGGILGVGFNNTWNSSNSLFSGKYYDSALTLNFAQPLFGNFGREATELSISVARAGKEASLDQFRTRLQETVAQVRNEYYRLYALREDLESKKSSLALAQKILDDNKARVRAGVMPAMEIQNAEFGVAQREKELIDAERAVRDQIDVIRNLLRVEEPGDIVPADIPFTEPVIVNVDSEVKKALENRPELRELKANLKAAELQAKVSRGKTLPDVSINGSVGLGGVAGDYPRDLDRLSSGKYPLWSAGFTVSYPLGNQAAENRYQQNRLKAEQLKTQIRNRENAIENEVRASARAVAAGYKQLDVTERGRIYAEERLNSYIRKNQVGLATTKDVLDVENDLVAAKTNQTKARSDYTAALTQLWKATGEILDREGIRIDEKKADELLVVR